MTSRIRTLFEPRSVVLIGLSRIREKLCMRSPQMFQDITYNITKYFSGETHIIDTEEKQAAKALNIVPHAPELAVVMLIPNSTIRWVQRGSEKGIKVFALLTGGFTNPQRKQFSLLKKEPRSNTWT